MKGVVSLSVLVLLTASVATAEQVALLPPPVLTGETYGPTPSAGTDAEMITVPVLARDLPAGSVVSAADLSTAKLPSRKVFPGVVRNADDIVGKQVTRAQKAGDTVARIHLKTVPVVASGSMVQLVFRRGGIELTGQGKALQDGQTGETVRVLNPDTRATLMATVTAPGMVSIQ